MKNVLLPLKGRLGGVDINHPQPLLEKEGDRLPPLVKGVRWIPPLAFYMKGLS